MLVWPGQPYPLGATYDGAGTNFAVFSEVAERVELCLFDGSDETASSSRRSTRSSGTATCRACSRASATASGCTARTTRHEGLRCNPAKLLLDPYAKADRAGRSTGTRRCFGYSFGEPDSAQRRRLRART